MLRNKLAIIALAIAAQSANARLPECWPSAIGGTGSKFVAGTTSEGMYIGWWCPKLYGWVYEYSVMLNGGTIRHPTTIPPLTLTGVLGAYWEANVIFDGNDPQYDAIFNAMVEPLNAIKPPMPVWLVAQNSTYPTRPTYRVVNNALVADTQRATVGNTCDCKTLSFVQSTSTYCQPAPLTGVVALCRKQ